MNRKTFSPRARGRHEFTDGVCAVCVAVALLLISNRVKYQRAQGNQMFLNLYQYVARYLRVDSKIVLSPMKARVRVFGINRHRGIISFSLAVVLLNLFGAQTRRAKAAASPINSN